MVENMKQRRTSYPGPGYSQFLSLCGKSFGEEGKEEKSHCGISWSDRRQVCGVWVINRDENV